MARTIWVGKVRRNGGAVVISVPPPVRRQLGLVPGDLMVWVVVGPYMVCRRLDPAHVVDVESIPADVLPAIPPGGPRNDQAE